MNKKVNQNAQTWNSILSIKIINSKWFKVIVCHCGIKCD